MSFLIIYPRTGKTQKWSGRGFWSLQAPQTCWIHLFIQHICARHCHGTGNPVVSKVTLHPWGSPSDGEGYEPITKYILSSQAAVLWRKWGVTREESVWRWRRGGPRLVSGGAFQTRMKEAKEWALKRSQRWGLQARVTASAKPEMGRAWPHPRTRKRGGRCRVTVAVGRGQSIQNL